MAIDVSVRGWRRDHPSHAEDEHNKRPWSSSWLKKRAWELERKGVVKVTPAAKRGKSRGR